MYQVSNTAHADTISMIAPRYFHLSVSSEFPEAFVTAGPLWTCTASQCGREIFEDSKSTSCRTRRVKTPTQRENSGWPVGSLLREIRPTKSQGEMIKCYKNDHEIAEKKCACFYFRKKAAWRPSCCFVVEGWHDNGHRCLCWRWWWCL